MEDIDLEKFFTVLAGLSASIFFLWQIITGWLVVNVEISIETERQTLDEDKDWLAFKINFKKGKTDTLQIKDLKAQVRKQDGSLVEGGEFSFDEIRRLAAPLNQINWSTPDPEGKNISLSPEESFHLGTFVEVPAGMPVIVEAVLHGNRKFWWSGFQWRASVASLPVGKEK